MTTPDPVTVALGEGDLLRSVSRLEEVVEEMGALVLTQSSTVTTLLEAMAHGNEQVAKLLVVLGAQHKVITARVRKR